MVGAIIGDVVGSRFEFNNHLSKKFQFFDNSCCFTDDTVMTCAVAHALLKADGDWNKLTPEFIVKAYKEIGTMYPGCGYGAKFFNWMNFEKDPKPYNSCGNGSAMRISPVGFVARTGDEVKMLSKKLTEVSHDHPEGLKGAECTAMCIYLARCGHNKRVIRNYVENHYYHLDKTCDAYRKEQAGQHGKEICQISVPQALECFFESNSFEDCIRNCVSIGGDTDTIAAIAGGIAEAYYGVPSKYTEGIYGYLDYNLANILATFRQMYIA